MSTDMQRKAVLWLLAIILLTACSSADATPTPTKTAGIVSPTETPRIILSTVVPPTVSPTTVSPPTVIPPTASLVSNPMATINSDMNVRGGPGTNYPIIGAASPGQQYPITGENSAGDWWEISYNGQVGWVFGQLVTATDVKNVRIAAIIPALTSTPRSTSIRRPTVTPLPTSTRRPARTATPSPAGCNLQLNIPDPPSPDTDCLVWEKLYALDRSLCQPGYYGIGTRQPGI